LVEAKRELGALRDGRVVMVLIKGEEEEAQCGKAGIFCERMGDSGEMYKDGQHANTLVE